MYPVVCHIYGDLYIHTYSLMLIIGLLLSLTAASKFALKRGIDSQIFINLVVEGALIGIIGGRLLHVLSELEKYSNFWQIFQIWQGGLSILGTIISVITYVTWYCWLNRLPLLTVLDVGCTYAPLTHFFGRLGCFFAGCCFGAPTNLPWGVIYTNELASAPLNLALHPTQLYSAMLYLIFYWILISLNKRKLLLSGQIFTLYLLMTSSERLLVDFFRNDRIFNYMTSMLTGNFLSVHQLISLAIALTSITIMVSLPKITRAKSPQPLENI